MVIDIEKLKCEIDILKRKLYSVKSSTEYKYVTNCIALLCDLYYELTGILIDCKTSVNPYYENILKNTDIGLLDYTANEYFNNQDFYNEVAINILNLYEKENIYFLERQRNQQKISRKEYFEIIHDFLSKYDYRLCNKSYNLIKNNEIDIDGNMIWDAGSTYNTFELNKQYVVIENNSSIEGAVTYIHELGHAFSYDLLLNRSKKQSYNCDYNFIEFYPHYLEKVFTDYLIKNNIHLTDAITSSNYFYESLYNYLFDLIDCNDYVIDDLSFENDELTPTEIKEYILDSVSYSEGLYLGCIKAYDANIDLEPTKEQVDNYLFGQGLNSKIESLEILGIDENEIFNGKKLQKSLVEHKNVLKKLNK